MQFIDAVDVRQRMSKTAYLYRTATFRSPSAIQRDQNSRIVNQAVRDWGCRPLGDRSSNALPSGQWGRDSPSGGICCAMPRRRATFLEGAVQISATLSGKSLWAYLRSPTPPILP